MDQPPIGSSNDSQPNAATTVREGDSILEVSFTLTPEDLDQHARWIVDVHPRYLGLGREHRQWAFSLGVIAAIHAIVFIWLRVEYGSSMSLFNFAISTLLVVDIGFAAVYGHAYWAVSKGRSSTQSRGPSLGSVESLIRIRMTGRPARMQFDQSGFEYTNPFVHLRYSYTIMRCAIQTDHAVYVVCGDFATFVIPIRSFGSLQEAARFANKIGQWIDAAGDGDNKRARELLASVHFSCLTCGKDLHGAAGSICPVCNRYHVPEFIQWISDQQSKKA
jgi:hypothetical protein